MLKEELSILSGCYPDFQVCEPAQLHISEAWGSSLDQKHSGDVETIPMSLHLANTSLSSKYHLLSVLWFMHDYHSLRTIKMATDKS